MHADFPAVKIGRPSGAHGDWFMTLFSGLLMGGITGYLLWPTTLSELLMLLPVLAIIAAVLATNFLRYTYGEVGPAGLLYRRPWGWRTAAWSEIASVNLDPEVTDVIFIKLRRGHYWSRRLRFQESLVLNDPNVTYARPELIEHLQDILRERDKDPWLNDSSPASSPSSL
jgi:hypothetical protein